MDNHFLDREFTINPKEMSLRYVNDKLNSNAFQVASPINTKQLGSPVIKFNLTTLIPNIVHRKYKAIYPEEYKLKLDKGLFNGFLNPPKFETWEERYKSDKIPDKGLIIPDSIEFQKIQPSGDDMSLLLDFVNIQDTADIVRWISKYGVLNYYSSEKYSHAQDIESFIRELTILKTLYQLFTAVNEYTYNTASLKKRVKFVKLANYMEEFELSLNNLSSPYLRFWGYDYSSTYHHEITKETIEKYKKRKGYLLFIDNFPTMSYFETSIITDDMLPIKTMNVISKLINYKTCYEIDGMTVNRYSVSAEVQPNANNSPALFRLVPSIRCSDILTLMYFQFLWLISTDGTKPCQKCGQYFTPSGIRPGKQKYCGSCGNHAAQDQYKKRTLIAIKDYKSGLTLEEAAAKNKISSKRLQKALKDGV